MTISFSGLASGLDTSSWVESLVSLKQAKVESLETEKEEVLSLQETLNDIKSFFSSFRSMIEKVTDAKFGVASMDLFAQNLATSSNLDILTASATTEAEEAEYNVLVDKLASETQASSNYSYLTTIVQTTTASGDSKLINLGVKAGNIGVVVNGVERGLTITENDTLSSFIEKLQNIGVEASYNEDTGIFSMNIDDDAINDIDGTGIVDALHLEGVNEGYTSNSLQTSTTDTVYSAATEATLLKDLGVKSGTITVHANDKDYNITIYDTSTLGSFIADLHGCDIDAELNSEGIFTISDAEITNEGTTDILAALGLATDIYGKSQVTDDLTHQTVVTQTTTATSSTLLKDLGEGIAIQNGQTVIVKNSNNEYTTITVGTTTTLGDLLEEMSNAGLYSALKSDGTVEISGGTITGGTFDAVEALGLEREPYSAMATGDPLTETVEVHELVTLQTKLVDDLKVKEGYLEVTDADGNKEYLKIYSGQTIADLMTDLANYGLSTSLDEDTGVLTITGGAFKTLSDADVQALVADGTIRETEPRYIQGTNLLECLYGSGTISTDHITVGSTYSKSMALTHSVINTINASLTTTLGNLGLTNGTAIFDVRGEKRTINVTQTMSLEQLMTALENQGIASSWDSDTSRITIENSTLTGGSSNLADVLNLTTTVSGKYVTSNELYSRETVTIDATLDTVLKNYGISNTMSTADRTVKVYDSAGNVLASTVVSEGTTIRDLLDFINAQTGVSANLKDGFLTVNNGYIENAALEASMGLETSNKSSYVLGSVMTVTTVAAVTGETTLGDIISTLGTTGEVAGGYNLNFNGHNLAVSASTTVNELINMIYANGGTAALDHTGRLSINGGTLNGTVAEALGITSVTHTSSVSASGETLYTEEEVYADRDTTFASLGINNSTYIIHDNLGKAIRTLSVSGTTTIGGFLDSLKSNGIDGTISDGVIKLDSAEGKYITGALANSLGITTQTTTEIVNTTQSSTAAISYTGTVTADVTSTLGDIGAVTGSGQNILIYNSDQVCIATISTLTTSSTVEDMFASLKAYGIIGTITNGVISLYSEAGSYAGGTIMNNLGISVENGINKTFTIAQTITSSDRITYTDNVEATESSLLAEFIPGLTSLNVAVYDSSSNIIGTVTINTTTTIGDFFADLTKYSITGAIKDGVISLTSSVGNYISNTTLTQHLGIDTTTKVVTVTTGATTTSTAQITYTEITAMTGDTKLSDLGINAFVSPITRLSESEAVAQGYTLIKTAADLEQLRNNPSGKFILMNDIDLGGATWNPITTFSGTLNGNGYTIENFSVYSSPSINNIGFFGTLSGATITNLQFFNANSSGSSISNNVGVLAGTVTDSRINNILIEESRITGIGSRVGMLIGHASDFTSITQCYTSGDIELDRGDYIGGIIGDLGNNADLGLSGSKVNITSSATTGASYNYMGGLVGHLGGLIRDSYSWGKLSSGFASTNPGSMGALVGDAGNGVQISNTQYCSSINPGVNPVGNGSPDYAGHPPVDNPNLAGEGAGLVIRSESGKYITDIVLASEATVNDMLHALEDYGITGSVSGGVITLVSANGNYITGSIPEALGISTITQTTTSTVGKTATSTIAITYTATTLATETSTLNELINPVINGTITSSGVTGDVIGISTAAQLRYLSTLVNAGNDMSGKTFILLNDINMTGTLQPIGNETNPFAGTFDGGGFTISNLNQSTSGEYAGLFGYTDGATIKNLNLYNTNITKTSNTGYAGALVAYAKNTTISAVYSANTNISSNGGALGGLVGILESSTLEWSANQGGAVVSNNNTAYMGGLVGRAANGVTISASYNAATIMGDSTAAGGLVGTMGFWDTTGRINEISNSFNQGYLAAVASTPSNQNGGLVGNIHHNNSSNNLSSIENCYNFGLFSGSSATNESRGSILGANYDSSGNYNSIIITNTFATPSESIVGSLRNINPVETNTAAGLTGGEITQRARNAGWDSSIWSIPSGGSVSTTYPPTLRRNDDYTLYIKEQNGTISGTLSYDGGTTINDLKNQLKNYGITVTINNGVLSFESDNGRYVTGSLADSLGIGTGTETIQNTVGIVNTSTAAVTYTEITTATVADTLVSLKYAIDGSISASTVTGTVIGISTAAQLRNLANQVNRGNNMSGKTFVLLNDIDLSGYSDWVGIGDSYSDTFNGTFDGAGHTISNINMAHTNVAGTNVVGFFGRIVNAEIKNLKLENVTITVTNNISGSVTGRNFEVGALVARGENSTISGVEVINANIGTTGNSINWGLFGGIAGTMIQGGTITNCSTSGTINTANVAGGIVGAMHSTTNSRYLISQTSSSMRLEGNIFNGGGIIGGNNMGSGNNGSTINIQNCMYSGTLTSTSTNAQLAGIYGSLHMESVSNLNITINHCYSTGSISAAGGSTAAFINTRDQGVSGTGNKVTVSNSIYNFPSDSTLPIVVNIIPSTNLTFETRNLSNNYISMLDVIYGFDSDIWNLTGSLDTVSLKVTNEYEGYAKGPDNQAEKISFNGSNTVQDVLGGIYGAGGSATFSDGKLTVGAGSELQGGISFLTSANTSREVKELTEDTLLKDIYNTPYYTITVSTEGTSHTITVSREQTVGSMLTQLAAYDIEGKVLNGKLTLIGNENSYITGMTAGLANRLGLRNTASTWYTVKSSTTTANTSSDTLIVETTATAVSGTTMGELGLSSSGVISLRVDGATKNVTINTSDTIGDIFTKLAAYGITGSINNGKVTFNGNENAYIYSIDAAVRTKLNLKTGDTYTTTVQTTYTNTDSDKFNSTIVSNLTGDTKLSDLQVGADGYITLMSEGTQHIITISPDMTVGDIISTLAGYGIAGSIHDGKLTLVGRNDHYITSISANIANALKLQAGEGYTYTSSQETHYQNEDSDRLSSTTITTLNTSSTFSDLGLTGNAFITVVTNGTEHVVTVTPDKTVDDIISTIAGFGISGSVTDGKLTFSANNGCYIKDMTQTLKNILKLQAGSGNSWTTEVGKTWVNSDSKDLNVEKDDIKITGDTVLSSINGFNNGNGSLIVHKTDGTFVTISVDATKTVDEFFEQISRYGLVGSIDSEGKATITGVGNVYLQAASGGSNILTALKLSNVVSNVQTVTVNRTSDTLKHTVTVAASGSTTLENLGDSAGNSITFNASGNASIVLETYSDAGNQHVTLNFSKTQSIYDVIDKLAEYGINASIDAKGRFSVTAPTLTDFDISGTLGAFLMGTYQKEYGKDTTYNVSTNLVEKTITNMTDASTLASFGITGGNILITQQGINYTVNIDTTNITTIGDFRNLLAMYGFTTNIDNSGRLSVSGIGDSYLSTISGGSNILDVLGLTDWTLGEITQSSEHLTDTEVKVNRISMSDKLSELTDAAGTNLGITAGQIYVYQDGTRSTINIDTNDTLETLAAKLSQYGITVGISQEGKLYFDGNNDSYLTTDGIASSSASNILSKIGIAGNWSTRYDSTSENLKYTEDVDNVMTGSTKLSELQDSAGNNLGITEGTYYVYSNGVRNTETITADTTVNDFMATLAKYGLIADIAEDGSISVGAYNNTYLATSALAGQNSNVVSTLFAEWDFVNIYTSNGLDIPKDEIRAINRDTKLADINEGTYQDGYITVIKDGVQTNISLSADDTVGTLMDELALYGFESVINDNGQLIIKNTGDSLLQNYTGNDKASNVLDLLGIGLNDWINTNTYKSETLDVVQTSTLDASATRDTLLSELGVSTGEYYVYNNGVKYTALISSDETLGSFMDTLKSFGLETSLVTGPDGSVLSIVGKGDSYIAKSNSATNASNVVEKLFTNGVNETKKYTGKEETSTLVTTYTAATEDTLLSYYDNGLLQAEGDLSVTVNGQTSIVKITADETFGSLMEKFKALGLEATMANGQIMIQSGYDTFTINTNGTTSNLLATIGLVYNDDLGGYVSSSDTVKSTTTSIEERTLSVSNYADNTTKMGMLNISDGSLTVYNDGQKATVQIKSDETFGDLQARLATAFADLTLEFKDGYLIISSKDGKSVEVGSTTDTSNFSAITGIAKDENGVVTSARELYCVNSDSVVTSAGLFRNGQVTEGTFIVGDATFTIGANTKLSDLISQINASDEANATAYWDNIDGKLVIKSRTTGAAYINIEAGTSNFTDIMGFTATEWNADGSVDVTRMNIDTQDIGDNAKLSINGTTYTSTSNTITSDVSRIKGLTINLKGLTEGSSVTLTVERDKETLANAISDVVDSYNELMKNVDEAIAVDGKLHSETTLKLIRNQLRSLMTSSDAGTTIFRNLDSIGISVSDASANNISTTTESIINLSFDKDKFLQAYEADEDAVKELLIGGTNNQGIFTKVETLLESSLQSVTGYFASTDEAYSREVNNLEKKIVKANEDIERYRARLEAKFSAMDMLIAQMQQQYSSFLTT